jgi:hypothetical protein
VKRGLLVLFVAFALPSCKSAAPKAPAPAPVPPDALRSYVDQVRILPHRGDERALTLDANASLAGECDVAVRVRTAAFEKGSVRFGLETIGTPRAGSRVARCQRLHPGSQLTLTGFGDSFDPDTVAQRVDAVLQTPEAYLAAQGLTFDLAAGSPPVEVASSEPDADQGERSLARKVTTWPKALLAVDTLYHDASERVRYEGEVALVAIVGTDGRLYQPRLKGSLDETHQAAVRRVLTLWRFEPARLGDAPVAARVPLRTALKIF